MYSIANGLYASSFGLLDTPCEHGLVEGGGVIRLCDKETMCAVGDAGITRTKQSHHLTHAELGGEAARALVVNSF
jgi:hypothetical protein